MYFSMVHEGDDKTTTIDVYFSFADICFSDADSGHKEEIEGPRGDDHAVHRDAARGEEPSRLHPQADCFDHTRG